MSIQLLPNKNGLVINFVADKTITKLEENLVLQDSVEVLPSIAIYGRSGIGKTKLLKELSKKHYIELVQSFGEDLFSKDLYTVLGSHFYEPILLQWFSVFGYQLKCIEAKNPYQLKFIKFVFEEGIIDFENAPSGLKQLVKLLPSVLLCLDNGGILLVDDLDSHFEIRVALAIVELFNNSETNPNGSQLVFTTHNEHLMATSLMRPDQVCTLEKKEGLELYRASDFKNIDWSKASVELAYHLYLLGGVTKVDYSDLQRIEGV
jgi:AAA15 family ATPase/GTPase